MKVLESKIQTDYENRIINVFNYIDENLDANLTLKLVSEVAFFSPYHFHRVFKFITGETLNTYIIRKRVEKSASDLIHKNKTITEIAITYGFKDNSSFTRTFKKYYGVSPTTFKKQNPNKFSKIRQLESKNGQAYPNNEQYICIVNNLKKWIKMNANIEVKETTEFNVAGINHLGIQGMESVFEKLIVWANANELLNSPEAKIGRMFYDSFKVTPADKVRMLIFLKTSESFESEHKINKVAINSGRCIVGRFEISPMEFEKSWSGLFIWMNQNGYKKSTENPFEIYHNDYREHPENKFIVDLFIPIE